MEASKGKEAADDGTAAKQRMLNIEKLKIRPAIFRNYRNSFLLLAESLVYKGT